MKPPKTVVQGWALARLCSADILAEVDRPTQEQRYSRMPVTTRDALIRSRVKLAQVVRSLLDSEGIGTELKKCSLDVFPKKVEAIFASIPEEMKFAIEPLQQANSSL